MSTKRPNSPLLIIYSSSPIYNVPMEAFNMSLDLISCSFLFFYMLNCCSNKKVFFIFENSISQFTAYLVGYTKSLSNIGVIPVIWDIPIPAYIINPKYIHFLMLVVSPVIFSVPICLQFLWAILDRTYVYQTISKS